MALASASAVYFPSTEPHGGPPSTAYNLQRPPHLPFRRISLPSAPSLLNRQSMASLASSESFQEEHNPSSVVKPALVQNVSKKSKARPTSVDMARKGRRKDARPVDEAKEAKRRKIIHEFYETERSYVDGLDLIYSHFLTPIIESLEAPNPLLDRAELTSVFSNFIDIWNLHRSFFTSLSTYLNTDNSGDSTTNSPPPLSPVLLSHFPYLSMYTPFVTSFSTAVSSLNSLLLSKPAFGAFVAQQEAHERCGKLKLRDWLLTIVQRCPRYLLLLKDLIGCTDPEDPEYASLTAVHALVSKITVSLNTSLHTHAQTLALLALQRSTPNLPFQLITPGRTFLKRAPLLKLSRSSSLKEREFLLFSDCLLWLASGDKNEVETWDWAAVSPGKFKYGQASRPKMLRTRSRSEAELTTMSSSASTSDGMQRSPTKKKRYASNGMDDKWVYKGHVDLVDLEVVVSPPRELGEERRLELLSPEISFAVYAGSEDERDEWSTAIRNAKASLFISLNAMHPNSTLTSSSSTNHLRRTLQALPHLPEEDGKMPKRGKVEHFVPAIWIPDGKTESCMRCGRTFGWRRRRHHCRLCGRCVCVACSGSTFFISDTDGNLSKSARACDACYDAVFPFLEGDFTSPTDESEAPATNSTLSGFPSWQSISMPSLALPGVGARASALMVDLSSPKRPLHRIDSVEVLDDGANTNAAPRIKVRQPSRPKSYVQILEEFQEHESGMLSTSLGKAPSIRSRVTGEDDDLASVLVEEEDSGDATTIAESSFTSTPRKEDTVRRHKRFSLPIVALQTTQVTTRPADEGPGRSKRFSLVLNGKSARSGHGHYSSSHHAHEAHGVHAWGRPGEHRPSGLHHSHKPEGDEGAAAGKLSQLLGRK